MGVLRKNTESSVSSVCGNNVYPAWFNKDDLQYNPAKRSNIPRLNRLQKKAFLSLISSKSGRNPRQLRDAGVVRPDWSFRKFMRYWDKIEDLNREFYLSDAFLEKWLRVGYISSEDLPREADPPRNDDSPVRNGEVPLKRFRRINHSSNRFGDDRKFINMTCAVVTDRNCFLWDCYLPYAKFDNVDFYKAFIRHCVLHGATAYGSSFEDCNGHIDAEWHAIRHMVACGMTGIEPHFLRSDADDAYSTDEEKLL